MAPPAPADLLVLIRDREARVRRRAALAVGRVGLSEALPSLAERLKDEEPEVRQMAAFAMGLIGDPAARGGAARGAEQRRSDAAGPGGRGAGPHRRQGRRAGRRATWCARTWLLACCGRSPPDDMDYPLSPPVEAARLGLFALARLGIYDAAGGGGRGRARRRRCRAWWPVAYALQRVGDPRAAPPLTLAPDPGPLHRLLRDPRAGGGQGHDGHPAAAHAGAGAQGAIGRW